MSKFQEVSINFLAECLFCKISNKDIPTEFLYEDSDILAFHDIHPLAPVHILIIPRKHVETIADIKESDIMLMGKIIWAAKTLAEKEGIAEQGYKLLFRVKRHGGQEVPHVHLHLIGGAPLSEGIHAIT